MNLDIFRAYDIRGIFGVDFEPERLLSNRLCVYRLLSTENRSVRTRCPREFTTIVAAGRRGFSGFRVSMSWISVEISTDMLYFAVVHYRTDGGVVISASHNPAMYNGMKLVRQHATPVSADTGLFDVRDTVKNGTAICRNRTDINSGTLSVNAMFMDAYLSHLRSFVNLQRLSSPSSELLSTPTVDLLGQIAERLLEDTPIQICERSVCRTGWKFRTNSSRVDQIRCDRRIASSPLKLFGRQGQT